jgi:hypothetical protein
MWKRGGRLNMTVEEFSNELDILLSSYNSLQTLHNNAVTIQLDEYEKSIFLTKAQEELVKGFYNGNNKNRDAFEETEEIRRYLSALVTTYRTSTQLTGHIGLSTKSVFYAYPEDLWYITYEACILTDERLGCFNGVETSVVPIEQDDFYKIVRNPFRGPSKLRTLRLDAGDNMLELISDYNISSYLIRYVSKLSPIILVDLTDDNISIGGISVVTECALNEVVHRLIVQRAFELIIASKGIYSSSKQT